MLNTLDLLQRVTAGEQDAVDALVDRSLPVFGVWVLRRIPSWAIGRVDVTAVVRSALLDALPRLRTVDASSPAALQTALRDAVYDRLVKELRAMATQSPGGAGGRPMTDSVLEHAAGRENLARYDRAVATMTAPDREAIIGRLEFRQSYEELATALGVTDAAAARRRVTKAVMRLVQTMSSLS